MFKNLLNAQKFSPSKYLGHTVCDTCTCGHMYDDHLYNWTNNIETIRHMYKLEEYVIPQIPW